MGRNLAELYRTLIAMQTADAFSIATPADWQPGDDVASSCCVAKERIENKEEMHCYDWFFYTIKLDKEKVLKQYLRNENLQGGKKSTTLFYMLYLLPD